MGLGITAISVLLFVNALIVQRNELALQRQELSSTREELKAQKEEFRLQNKNFEQQLFKTTVFEMLRFQNEILNSLVRYDAGKYQGRDAIASAIREIRLNINAKIRSHADRIIAESNPAYRFSSDPQKLDKAIQEVYIDLFERKLKTEIRQYIVNLYYIFKFIYLANVDTKEKRFYAGLVRAQLSPSELELLFYNGVTEYYGNPRFLFLMKEYDILQHFTFPYDLDVSHEVVLKNKYSNIKNPFDEV